MNIYCIMFSLFILAYAVYYDIRKRSVPNALWLVMAGVGIAFTGYVTVVQGTSFLLPLVFSTAITATVSYIFFRSGFFGAADAKALICIAILFPAQPGFTILSHQFPILAVSVPVTLPFALITLSNAAFLALAVPIYLFLHNLHSLGLRKFTENAAMCFVAYRVNINGLRSGISARLTHTYEETDGQMTRKYSFSGSPLNSETVQRLKTYHGEGKIAGEVWVTPQLPFILFITMGFLAGCLLGI